MAKNIEKYNLVSRKKCNAALVANPTYRVYWRSGFEMRGACEREVDRKADDFSQQMQRKYDWAAGIDLVVDHDNKEIHMNGFSSIDLWC